jgi:hypothetical protein
LIVQAFLFTINEQGQKRTRKIFHLLSFLTVHAEAPAFPLWEIRFQIVIIAVSPKQLSKFLADNFIFTFFVNL